MKIVQRTIDTAAYETLLAAGYAPVMARLYAARGVSQAEQLDTALAKLIPPQRLTHNEAMSRLLSEAIAQKK